MPGVGSLVEGAKKIAPWLTAGVAAVAGWWVGPFGVGALAAWIQSLIASVPNAARISSLLSSLTFLGIALIGVGIAGTSTGEMWGYLGIGVFAFFAAGAAHGFLAQVQASVPGA